MKITIGNIVGVISIIVSINIYQSYLFFSELLESYGLNSMSIYTMEDLYFTFGKINAKLFIMAFSGYFVALIISNVISNDIITTKFLSFFSWFKQNEVEQKKKIGKIVFLLFFSIIIVVSTCVIIRSLETLTLWLMAIIIFVIPTLLVLFPKFKSSLTPLLFLLILTWFNLFAHDAIANFRKNETNAKSDELSFTYSGRYFRTGRDTIVIFHGYENMIVSYGNGKHFMKIPTDKIENLEFSK